MSEKQKTMLQALIDALNACTTVTDLFKVASDDGFFTASHALPPEELAQLRDVYRARQTELDGKVKLETLAGQVLHLVNVDWWHSDAYDNDGVTLTVRPERNIEQKYKAMTSSAPIVRFCQRFANEPPTEKNYVRIIATLSPHRDPDKARQGYRIWSIKQLPRVSDVPSGSPF